MRPPTTTLTESGTLPGEDIEFRIGDPRWIMHTLSDLYSDRILACIREYSTNAWDAHIEAGNNSPIHVILPDVFNPVFSVEDFGTGMDGKTLRETYTVFGESPKRSSNKYNGMLGFGSKSAAAYTNQFNITTTKNGTTIFAVVNRREDWSLVLTIVSEKFTGNPNGTKIEIPVADHRAFTERAKDFYRFWKPGTVLVNGQPVTQDVGSKIDTDIYYSNTPGSSFVVMGNVPYRINNPGALFTRAGMAEMSFVAYVPMGEVEFSNSREDLKYSKMTNDALKDIIAKVETRMVERARDDIKKAINHYDAWTIWQGWCEKLGVTPFKDVTYKGDTFIRDFPFKSIHYRVHNGHGYGSRYNLNPSVIFTMTDMKNSLIITGFDLAGVTSYSKTKVRDFMSGIGMNANNVYFVKEPIPSEYAKWLDANRMITWEKLKSVCKKPRAKHVPGLGRKPQTFDGWDRTGSFDEKDLPKRGNLYYVSTANSKSKNISKVLELLDNDGIVVKLAENRIEKFKRDNPRAKDFLDYVETAITWDGAKLLGPTAIEIMSLSYDASEWYEIMGRYRDDIDDPEIIDVLDKMKAGIDKTLYEKHRLAAGALHRSFKFKHVTPHDRESSLFDKYPLLRHINRYNLTAKKDFVLYLNAAYAAKKG